MTAPAVPAAGAAGRRSDASGPGGPSRSTTNGARSSDPADGASRRSSSYSAMWAALDDQLSETRREMDPVARARRLADVLRVLRDLVQDTAAERDRALIELLRLRPNTSSQDLAPELGMTRQRLDQLRVHAAHGGRPPATG